MTSIKVKSWIGEQKKDEMRNYKLLPCYVYGRCGGHEFYINEEDDSITFVVDSFKKETEKAVQVSLQVETIGGRGHAPFTVWFPKSQIIEMNK